VIPGLRRGTIWIADLPPPWNRRPAVIVTRDDAIPLLTNVTLVLVTRTIRGVRTEVLLGPEHGVQHECVAACDNSMTLAVKRLTRRLGELGPEKILELNAAIRIALDLD
jgi:mRNA interferase MazF